MAHILLADDDEDSIEIWSRVLLRRGDTLTIARNATDAIELTEQKCPDVILMDMGMPMSPAGEFSNEAGLFAVCSIKANPLSNKIPIIALTGHGLSVFRNKIMEAGCADMLSKPVESFSHLTEAIDMALKQAAKT